MATLTPAQLTRKRANDREAQRAIRCRTKEHIARLEQEVLILKEQEKMKEKKEEQLQSLRQQNESLERELMGLRDQLLKSENNTSAAHYPSPGKYP